MKKKKTGANPSQSWRDLRPSSENPALALMIAAAACENVTSFVLPPQPTRSNNAERWARVDFKGQSLYRSKNSRRWAEDSSAWVWLDSALHRLSPWTLTFLRTPRDSLVMRRRKREIWKEQGKEKKRKKKEKKKEEKRQKDKKKEKRNDRGRERKRRGRGDRSLMWLLCFRNFLFPTRRRQICIAAVQISG